MGVVGEIYVRLDPFANDHLVDKLEARGVRVLLAPFSEWLEYTTGLRLQRMADGREAGDEAMMATGLSYAIHTGMLARMHRWFAIPLGWPPRTTVEKSLEAAEPYVSAELAGEAVLTVGGPLHEHESGTIDAVIAVGPHECMPNKIAEAQFSHVGEEHGMLSLSIPVNGDPTDPEILDRFVFEVHERFADRAGTRGQGVRPGAAPLQLLQGLPRRALRDAFLSWAPPMPSGGFAANWVSASQVRDRRGSQIPE